VSEGNWSSLAAESDLASVALVDFFSLSLLLPSRPPVNRARNEFFLEFFLSGVCGGVSDGDSANGAAPEVCMLASPTNSGDC